MCSKQFVTLTFSFVWNIHIDAVSCNLLCPAAPLTGDQLPPHVTGDQLPPHVTEDECRLLFSSLCVHGVLRVQARACALLLRLCGSQPWWGEMVVSTASDLFSPQQNTSFNKKRWGGVYISLYSSDFLSLSPSSLSRVLLQLSALCQRSSHHSSVITSLLHTLSSLLPPSPTPTADPQLHWLLLLLSHSLSSLHSSHHHNHNNKDPHLFTPTLTPIPDSERSRKTKSRIERKSATTLCLPYPLTHNVVARTPHVLCLPVK